MGATFDSNKPSEGNAFDSDLDQIRDNLNFMLICAANSPSGPVVIPGWLTVMDTSANNNNAKPDAAVLTKGTREFIINYTWD